MQEEFAREIDDATESYFSEKTMKFIITSPAFSEGNSIPHQYTCDGNNSLSPPLVIHNPPLRTQSFVLTVEDPDIPQVVKDARGIEVFDHWILYNIPPDTHEIGEGEYVGNRGLNSNGTPNYTGPCPPTQHLPTTHRYIFTIYALSSVLSVNANPTKDEIIEAMQNKILAQATLIGTYDRTKMFPEKD